MPEPQKTPRLVVYLAAAFTLFFASVCLIFLLIFS